MSGEVPPRALLSSVGMGGGRAGPQRMWAPPVSAACGDRPSLLVSGSLESPVPPWLSARSPDRCAG